MSVSVQQALQLLNDPNITERVKLEDLLSVATGARSMALVIIPTEFPEAERVKADIEWDYLHRYAGATGERGLAAWLFNLRNVFRKLLMSPIRFKAQLVRESFHDEVLTHPNHRALIRWTHQLGLAPLKSALLPDMDELYVTREELHEEIQSLGQLRHQIRQQTLSELGAEEGAELAAFPEALSPHFVATLGRLLGYPSCCIEAHIRDVQQGDDTAFRAAEQLEPLEEVNEIAYFSSGFYPCKPTCEAARQRGQSILDVFLELDARVMRRMRVLYRSNQAAVRQYPRLLGSRLQRELRSPEEVMAHE